MANTKSTSRARATRTNARRNNADSMKNMRNRRFVVLVALLAVALVSAIGVAVAAFSTDLEVRGTATVQGPNWNVHFDNLSEADVQSANGTAREITAPEIYEDGTVIGDYEVILKSDGDSITYTFDVKNDGELDAMLTKIAMGNGSCSSESGTADEQKTRNQKTCDNIKYTLGYADSTKTMTWGDVIKAGESETLVLKLEYNAKGRSGTGEEYYPDAPVTVTELGVYLTYSQH